MAGMKKRAGRHLQIDEVGGGYEDRGWLKG